MKIVHQGDNAVFVHDVRRTKKAIFCYLLYYFLNRENNFHYSFIVLLNGN